MRQRRIQPRINDLNGNRMKRIPTSSSLHPAIEADVQFTARKFGVSPSWVRAEAQAWFFGKEDLQASYLPLTVARHRRKSPIVKRRKTRTA
jgi:hypothetical protein